MHGEAYAGHVHNGVQRTDFVEVNFRDGDAVGLGFCGGDA